MSSSQPDPASSPAAPPEGPFRAAPEAAGRLAGWRPRLERVVIALVGIVAGLENVLIWVDPRPAGEVGNGEFNARRVWAHLLRAARWLNAMRARLAEDARAERAARRAEQERLGERAAPLERKPGSRRKPRPAAEKPEPDDCIVGRTDQEVMALILADLAVVARILGDDDAARRLAIYQREAQALLGDPPQSLVAEAEARRRMAGRSAASRQREQRQRESAGQGAAQGAGNAVVVEPAAAMAVSAPDSG